MRRLIVALLVFEVPIVGLGMSIRAQTATVHESPHKRLRRSCEKCHVATSFTDIRFDHEDTDFSLVGRHSEIACLHCHNVEDFAQVAAACVACHQDVHRGRVGIACEDCHTPMDWKIFDADEIHSRSSFPLMGRHVLIDCEACHPGIPYTDFLQSRARCVDCHRQLYLNVPSPNHAAYGFSTECQDCHQMLSWQPARFPEHEPLFPIFSGRHRGMWSTCDQCHTEPGNGSVFSCLTCHEHRQSAMDPSHAGLPGYAYTSDACYQCHPTGEAGEFADHDPLYFPIYSGVHAGRWSSCTICHTTPGDRSLFSCVECHEHSQARMDDKHLGEVTGYTFTPTSCYDCHPTGRKE